MYPWLQVFQNQLKESFSQARFHHAQLLYGLEGVGKSALATNLANALLCVNTQDEMRQCGTCKSCNLFNAQSHPDLFILSAEQNSIGVDEVRALNEFIFHSAQQGGNKVVVIEQIEKMTESATNALLKTLEEPALKRYILMTCDDLSKIKATILSRCNKVQVNIIDNHQIQSWVGQQGINTALYPWLENFYDQPLLLQRWLTHGSLDEVDNLWKVAHDIVRISDIAALDNSLSKDPSLLNVFCRFLMSASKQQVMNGQLNFIQYQHCVASIEKFLSDHHGVLGLNRTLSLSNLVFGLQSAMKQD
ncbi:DNA polymerase III subunit delta' [Pseudoalteromonas luteoviolacea]|uniref:DNA polymerase III subunit delta' n=1 Tax=Pseudoalteromonas luteoviolacea TaxID=43657 RepID=UPI001B364FD7|nr:DNA polymerase III subunit delta' [Pseudoalteromonas luteoviolacea]MBQ4812840.1 DNA polymerase III subunit delta' [Pseudoalteromonas luteoviolacea]